MKTQKTIGDGSMGAVWADVSDAEISTEIATAAATNGITAEQVAEKIAAGKTIWLDPADAAYRRKLRGFDSTADAAASAARDASRAARLAHDGYQNYY